MRRSVRLVIFVEGEMEKRYPGAVQNLLESLNDIENIYNVSLQDENFIIGKQLLLHIFNHETLHAVIFKRVPCIKQRHEAEETLIDEIPVNVLNHDLLKKAKLQEKLKPWYIPNAKKMREISIKDKVSMFLKNNFKQF